jgi:hypothetical protein
MLGSKSEDIEDAVEIEMEKSVYENKDKSQLKSLLIKR